MHPALYRMRSFFARFQSDLLALGLLLALPLILFAPVVFGNRTLLPTDNLLSVEPWRSAAPELTGQADPIPHNALLSDLVLENYAWKRFILQALQAGELPLWNPHQFAGLPFLAAGQHSALYPFSIFFYLLPLPQAYGLFTVTQLALAGWFAYLFLRMLGVSRLAALGGAIVYQLNLFMVVSVVFSMIIAGAAWLPLVLTAILCVIRQQPALGDRPATLPWVALGAFALGCQILAGHVEITYYTLLIAGAFSAWQLGALYWQQRTWGPLLRRALALLSLAGLGITLGAIQLIPLYELVQHNFRSGSATFEQVLGWSYPWRRLIAFFIPNFYGNPSHHTYFDLFTWQWTLAPLNNATIDWGIKNYVEGGAYMGLLPWLLLPLAGYAWLRTVRAQRGAFTLLPASALTTLPFFLLLTGLAFAFIFPTRLYALIFWLPGINQLHSPFRWVWPLTLCFAVLSAYGLHYLQQTRQTSVPTSGAAPTLAFNLLRRFCLNAQPSLITFLAGLAVWGGAVSLVALISARVFYPALAPMLDRLVVDLAKANEAFSDGRMFFSYEARWVLIFGLMLLAAGIVLRVSRCPIFVRGRPIWEFLAVGVLALDLLVAGAGFNPAADPALLSYTPPSIEFLRQDPGLWRFTTYDPHGQKPYNANLGWYFDLYDVRGYDSIFPMQYRRYMELIEPQYELEYNRIAPLSKPESLDSPLVDLLNVKYIITLETLNNPKYELVYQGEVNIYRNLTVMPRAYLAPLTTTMTTQDFGQAVQQIDPRQAVLVSESAADAALSETAWPTPIADEAIIYTANEVTLQAETAVPAWLVLADSYFAGWKAFVRPAGSDETAEREVKITLVNGNFRGVQLEPGAWTVRFKYSPDSVKLGGILSFLAGVALLFGLGVFTWRYFYRESAVDSTARRVAKNSLAPMVLNLLNRSIDLMFAAFMLRVLGPGDAGKYYFAIVVFGWFEIITNYGLNTLLTREVARDRDHANRYLVNTTLLRLLIGAVATPGLILLLGLRQFLPAVTLPFGLGSFAPEPLTADTLWAIGLLVIAQIPATVATGLSALFYAFEKAEFPAAIATLTTLFKVSLGTIALVLGWGFVGLAGVSIVVNTLTLVILVFLAIRLFFRPRLELDWPLQRQAVRESFPLMLNNLLATLFFKVDVTLLQPIRGDIEVGWYSTGYKFVDAYNVIPSLFTFALFPVMARQAQEDLPALRRSYALAVKLLVAVALPCAVITTALAPLMVGLLGGAEYLPYGAIALSWLVWSIPFGWINSVTNYVLIALHQQHGLTRAFTLALLFNIALNLLLVPQFGYAAAAGITIASEIFEGIAFYWYLRRSLGPMAWGQLLGPLWASALGMAAVTWGLWGVQPVLALVSGCVVYGLGLTVLRAFAPAERQLLLGILPTRVRQWPLARRWLA